jgi:hypothetical protein
VARAEVAHEGGATRRRRLARIERHGEAEPQIRRRVGERGERVAPHHRGVDPGGEEGMHERPGVLGEGREDHDVGPGAGEGRARRSASR